MAQLSGKNIKALTLDGLKELCDRLREKIISTVMLTGGHLSSNLGIIELTVALHRVFNFPSDKLIFDVGHQCYAHKLLSGREESFDTLR
ncbi:MAG: 1-deoxy-D-xylulose-5-phosphate synthase, partial [Clostridia bacterium]|nr:1-deoxy-D-xylulose-5-phosphate synthase [Clostridia bacterium]